MRMRGHLSSAVQGNVEKWKTVTMLSGQKTCDFRRKKTIMFSEIDTGFHISILKAGMKKWMRTLKK